MEFWRNSSFFLFKMGHYLKICQQRWSWTGGCLLLPLSPCPCPSQDSLITLKILLISQCITGVCATIEFLNTAVALIRHLGWLCLLSSGKSKLCGVQRVGQLPFSKHRSHRCHVAQVHDLEETIIRALHWTLARVEIHFGHLKVVAGFIPPSGDDKRHIGTIGKSVKGAKTKVSLPNKSRLGPRDVPNLWEMFSTSGDSNMNREGTLSILSWDTVETTPGQWGDIEIPVTASLWADNVQSGVVACNINDAHFLDVTLIWNRHWPSWHQYSGVYQLQCWPDNGRGWSDPRAPCVSLSRSSKKFPISKLFFYAHLH